MRGYYMNVYEVLEKHESVINTYINRIKRDNYQEVLSSIYNYVKSITHIYSGDGRMQYAYKFLMEDMLYAENMLPHIKLLDVPIQFYMNDKKDDFIEYIVQDTRKYLIKEHLLDDDYSGDISDIDFTNDCDKAALHIKKLCDKNNVESYILPIYPGYNNDARLYDGSGYHFANIVKHNNKYELVDVTYSQFFYERRNNLDRLGVVNFSGCYVGAFMLMNEEGKKLATKLIHDGHIELDEEVFKAYLDPFTISFRNGLYYENTNDFSYATIYSADDYIKFLIEEDNQVNHEGKENLGYQKKPLKNSNLKFRK